MSERLKNMILSDWHLMRVVRLVFGIFFVIQAFVMKDWLVGVVGAWFSYQAITNTGCCGTSCATTPVSYSKEKTNDITYEEVK